MKSWNSDFIVVGTSSLIILLFSTLLYFDFTKKLSVANAQEIGTITFKKKIAQRKYSGQVVWEEVDQNMLVFNNDTIRTSEISEAVVHLKDGTDISLDENSMILLSIDANAININFSQGSIFAKRGGIQGDVKEITIQSQDAKVSITNSDVQLTKTEKKDLDLTVTGGSAKVQIADNEQVVEKDQKIILAKGSKELKIVKLQIKPISPDPNKYFITSSDFSDVGFSWEPVEGNPDIYLEISRDKDFGRPIVKRKSEQNSVTERLQAGTYYWQLRAVDGKNGGAEVSGSRKLTVMRDTPARPIFPQQSKEFTYTAQPPMIQFRWSAGDLATAYVIEIARDPQYKSVVKSVETAQTAIAFGDLEAGEYHWRVKSRVQFGTVTQDGASETMSFTVKKIREIAPPELIAPLNKRIISTELIRKKELIFSWGADSRFNNYRLIIARDVEFKDIVARIQVNTNYHAMATDLPAGEYYWKVQPVAEGEDDAIFSKERSFNVISTDRLGLLMPAPNMEYLLKEDQKEVPVTFSWEKSPISGNYQFELSADKTFSSVLERKTLSLASVTQPSLKAGKYYWRIRLLDENRSLIMGSEAREFTVSTPRKDEAALALEAEKALAAQKELAAKMELEKKEKEKIAGTMLTVNSPVRRSAIYINGKLKGTSTVSINPVPGEKISITVKAQGYDEYRTEVVLQTGDRKVVNARLVDLKLMPRIRWKTNVQASVISKPVYEKDVIVVNTTGGGVVALNKYGNLLWRRSLGSTSKSTPVIDNSSVYVDTVDSNLYSLDLNSGKINWKQTLDGPLLFGAQPLTVNGRVFAATSYGKIVAFSAKDGKELWKRDIMAGVFSSMEHYDDLLFIGTDQSMLYALDDEDGDTEWDFEVDSRIISSSPKVYKDTLYVGCYSGSFYAIDASRGRLKWKFKAEQSILSNPAFHGETVYVGSSDGKLYALNAQKGNLQWKFDAGSKTVSEPEMLNDELFVTSGNSVFSLKLDTGKVSWSEKFDTRINSGASVVEDTVCLGLENGDVVLLRTDLVNVVK